MGTLPDAPGTGVGMLPVPEQQHFKLASNQQPARAPSSARKAASLPPKFREGRVTAAQEATRREVGIWSLTPHKEKKARNEWKKWS